jgi:hypothetical protein
MQRLRKRIHVSPATAIATLALVFAMTGGAYAAKRYLITSTKQISPKVLKSLKGAKGANGANGANGAQGATGPAGATGPGGATGPAGAGATGPAGATGATGAQGPPGTTGFTKTLPSKETEKGDWSASEYVSGAFRFVFASVSFVIPLEAAPIPVYNREGKTNTHCTGSAANPGAEPGYLCVFAHVEEGILHEPEPGDQIPTICAPGTNSPLNCLEGSATTGSADPSGFGVLALSEGAGHVYAGGTWAVTAE